MYRVILALALFATAASADPDIHATGTTPAEPSADHAIYVDVLGKAGLWGLGYDWRHRWFAIGATASYFSFDGDRITNFAPYVAAYPIGRGRHHGFIQLGPTVSRRTTPSPVAEWDGMTTTQLGGELCAGYEYRNHVLFRGYAMVSKTEHVMPWLGVSLGWTL